MKTTNLTTAKRVLGVFTILILFLTIMPLVTVAAPPQDGPIVYSVQFGDTLYSISRRFGTTVPAIMAANGLTGDYIFAGERLTIPVGSPGYQPYFSIFAPQPLPTQQLVSNPVFSCTYPVQYRDTVFSIAYRYRVNVPDLMQANNLYSPIIFAGRTMNVPCNSPTPAPFSTYVVQSGDNLFRIAVAYNTTIYALALVNGIPHPSLIFAGQKLVIAYPGSYIWPPSARPGTTHVFINQFRTRGPRGVNDEFIELYNPTTQPITITGWLVRVSNGSGIVDTRVTISTSQLLQSGQHFLIANSAADGYGGSVVPDQGYNADITDDGGIALTMPDGTFVDQVGMSSGSAFKEGSILPPFTTNDDRAYERRLGGASGNCYDTNNNATDFYLQAPSEPRDLASPSIVPCAAPVTPAATVTPTAATTPTATTTPTSGTTAVIIMQGNAFLPNSRTIPRGTTVLWQNAETTTTNHTVTSGPPGAPDNKFRSGTLVPNQTFTFTFNDIGTYPYFDEIAGASMTGTIIVQ